MTKTRVRYGISLVYALAGSAILLLLVAVLASAGDGDGGVRKIVVFCEGASRSEMMATANIVGAKIIHDLSFISAVAVELSSEAEATLAKDPRILRIDDDPMVDWLSAVDGPVDVPECDAQVVTWNIKHVLALAAQKVAQGENVKLVVIDTGVGPHPDIHVVSGKSFVGYTTKYDDDNGHGMHVSGIVAAINNRIGVLGVAPMVRLYAAKVLNFVGGGYLSDVIAGIDWAIKIGAQVINMSLGL